jgi:hypothetical protein
MPKGMPRLLQKVRFYVSWRSAPDRGRLAEWAGQPATTKQSGTLFGEVA